MTDLRSASVNNENFAQVAVKHNFHHFLQHSSGLLLDQITEYVNRLEGSSMDKVELLSDGLPKGPKVRSFFVLTCVWFALIRIKSSQYVRISVHMNDICFKLEHLINAWLCI